MDQTQNAVQEPPESEEQGDGEETISAGESGAAADVGRLAGTEVVIGEIPAADETTTMLWTARCSEPSHELLGQFATRDEAETAREEHLEVAHGGATT